MDVNPPRSGCTRARLHGSPPAADTAGAPHELRIGGSGFGQNFSGATRSRHVLPTTFQSPPQPPYLTSIPPSRQTLILSPSDKDGCTWCSLVVLGWCIAGRFELIGNLGTQSLRKLRDASRRSL